MTTTTRHSIDISKWDAAKRSVRYRMTRDETAFGFVIGDSIGYGGRAEIAVFGTMRASSWTTVGTYGVGDKVGEFYFVNPDKEVEEILDVMTGRVKPGAPLPELEKGSSDTKDEPWIDPLASKPLGSARKAAPKNT